MIKNSVKMLFGIYCALVFVASLPVLVLAYAIIFNCFSKQKAPHIAHKLSQYWAKFLLLAFFIRLKVKNKEKIDPLKTYVFVCNHQSQLDIPVFALACTNTFRFLSKAELTKIPLLGYVIKNLYITVDRKDKVNRSRSIQLMKQSIYEHISVFICPEGTRNRSDQPLLNFKDGAFRLAIETQTPLAVLTLIDSGKRNSPKIPLAVAPGTIHGIWSEPIPTNGLTIADAAMLKEKAQQLMLNNLGI